MNFTEQAVKVSRNVVGAMCRYRDNLENMRREACDMDGNVHFWVSADAIAQMDRATRREIMGSIGDAPWGAFVEAK